MKKVVLLLGLCFTYSPLLAFTDGPAQVQRHAQFLEYLKRWNEQFKFHQKQIESAKEQLKSLTGVRDIETVLSEIKRVKGGFESLIDEVSNVDNLLDQGFGSLDPKTRRIFQRHGIGQSCPKRDDRLKRLCEGRLVFEIGNMTEQDKILKETQQLIEKLNILAEGSKKAKDTKEALDYANQINATLAMLQAQDMRNNFRRQNEERIEKLARKIEVEIDFKKLTGNK
ncbi:MAG: hypothetical protein GKC53_05440 [Neisseriaceae bacterium]|nr:MAG: hypothetical protein GKC53_05440 [Neisseriaceae bacterium]